MQIWAWWYWALRPTFDGSSTTTMVCCSSWPSSRSAGVNQDTVSPVTLPSLSRLPLELPQTQTQLLSPQTLTALIHQARPWWLLESLPCGTDSLRQQQKCTAEIYYYWEHDWLTPLLPLLPLGAVFTPRTHFPQAPPRQQLRTVVVLRQAQPSKRWVFPMGDVAWGLLISLISSRLLLSNPISSSLLLPSFHRCQTCMWSEASLHLLQFLPINLLHV